ncbi:hypothetical protein EK21DRAFT_97348 [Setomelanomma holmii]|uniref:DUF7707 domain-containing protein n=1 Tax=Setomelanomma holmii TaxID=210430 RepID=A0A9P4LSF1_9PLEO|nr:hypothetical protein EK21DRAFT_97348 [Setomelanomma holmii]
MLYSTLLVAASAIAGASAQLLSNQTFQTPISCCNVAASSIPSDERSSWCEANVNTCVNLCGGQAGIANNGNECDDTTLEYTCRCSNGTSFAGSTMAPYQQSVPALMCRYWYGVCVNATNQNLAQQFQCEQARDANCGNLTVNDAGAVSSSGAPMSATASRTSGASSSPTGSHTAAASTGAAVAFAQYGAPILAGGLLAVFGIAL